MGSDPRPEIFRGTFGPDFMRVLVTGAQGQLVSSLVERAGNGGMDLTAVGRPELDLAQPGNAAAAIASTRPDVVINAAAYTAVDRAEDEPEVAFRINAEGAGEVATAAARIGAPVIQISTDYVFDGRSDLPYREELGASSAWCLRSKQTRWRRARSRCQFASCHRPDLLALQSVRPKLRQDSDGCGQTRDVLAVVVDQVGSPTSALDLADGLLRIVQTWLDAPDRGMSETYHLANSGETSWFGLAEFVMGECRKHSLASAEVRPIMTSDWPTRAVRPTHSVFDSSKFARDFGFTMPAWQESVSFVVRRIAAEAQTGG